MIVAMFVLMAVLVAVVMRVLMSVYHVPVCVLVGMAVVVVMRMEMLVFVVALHGGLLSLRVAFTGSPLSSNKLGHQLKFVNNVVWLSPMWYPRHTFRSEGHDSCHAPYGESRFRIRCAHRWEQTLLDEIISEC
jgi:hypothetical protein